MNRKARMDWIAVTALIPGAAAAGQGESGVWVRQFDPPAPVNVVTQPFGESFLVWSPELGLLRYPVAGPLYDSSTSCLVESEVTPREGGFDVAYEITNPTQEAVELPSLILPGFTLDAGVEMLDHAFGLEWAQTQPQPGGSITSRSLVYPRQLYAPVLLLRNYRVAVGISLAYPVLDYRHGIRFFAARWPGDPNWTAYLHLEGQLAPGATRAYSVSVRYSLPGDWIHTLQPYRDYFWSLYGDTPVYAQDLRPVYGAYVASASFFGPDNPRGFYQPHRPDLNGWAGVAMSLLAKAVDPGYRRIMMWAPSGLYQINATNNYPPQFMSEWSTPMAESTGELERLREAGAQLCYWWGHSARVADQWDDPKLDFFNPGDPSQLEVMQAEWALAVQRGADGVGLDAFNQLDLWLGLPWLETMRSSKPDAFFVVESAGPDVLHLHAPFWINGYDLPTPHLMADYLVPAREIWAHLAGSDINADRVQEIQSWGMTVCTIGASVLELEIEIGEASIPAGGP